METSEYEQSLRACINQNKHVIRKLSELAAEAESHHTTCNVVKTGGTLAGVAGTGIMIGSLLAAPFTGGASLAVTLAAAGCSVGGAATNIVTGVVDRSKSKGIIAEIQSLIDSRQKVALKLKEQSEYFSRTVEDLISNGMLEENAVNLVFNALANVHLNLKDVATQDSARAALIASGRLIQIEMSLLKTLESTTKVTSVLSAAIPGSHQLILKSVEISAKEAAKLGLVGKEVVELSGHAAHVMKTGGHAAHVMKTGGHAAHFMKTGGQAASVMKTSGQAASVMKTSGQAASAMKTGGQAASLMKTIGTVAVITSVVVTVVDVASLIRDWASDHPTIRVINNIKQQLQDETNKFEELYSTIDAFRDRIYFATIDDIPIIGSISQGNEIIIALLTQDLARCVKICEQIDIQWPFKNIMTEIEIARLLIENNAVHEFNEEEVKTIVQKRGKRASAAIQLLYSQLVEKVEQQKQSAINNKEKSKRSQRGEHVINNSVINVQRDIIDMFLTQRLGMPFGQLTRIPPESAIYQAYHHPFTADITNNIRNVMVAHIPDDVFYFDSNAMIYGILIYILRYAAKNHMQFLYDNPGLQGSPQTATLRTTRFLMNQMRVYVDDFALNYWLTYQRGNPATYEISRIVVWEMFSDLYDQMKIWIQELKRFGY